MPGSGTRVPLRRAPCGFACLRWPDRSFAGFRKASHVGPVSWRNQNFRIQLRARGLGQVKYFAEMRRRLGFVVTGQTPGYLQLARPSAPGRASETVFR